MAQSKEFVYSAKAVAVAADISGPNSFQLKQAWASRALPFAGGVVEDSADGPKGNQVLSFTKATTRIEGTKVAGGYKTVARVEVTGLNVLNMLTGDLRVTMTSTYQPNDSVVVELDPTDNPFGGIRIRDKDGNAIPVPGWDRDLASLAGKAFKDLPQELKKKRAADGGKKPKHHKHKHGDVFFTSLVDDVNKVKWNEADQEYGFVTVPGLGKVYFVEWSAEPFRQCLTMLRIELDPPFNGWILIADPDEDGRPYPGGL